MKKLLVLLFSILISFNSYGEWTFHSTNSKGDKFYLDYETIRTNGGYVYYWELVNHKKSDTYGNMSVSAYYQGDCGIFRINMLSLISHSQSMGTGAREEFNYEPNWKSAPPSSIRAHTLNLVCDYAN